ncbi:hypothetical protein ACS0TY_022552 [Phlomoides rotata]
MEAPAEVESEELDVNNMEEGKKESCLVGRLVTSKTSSSEKSQIIEERKEMSATLPHDIIENILSRLPVKYLLRFKLVSKLWEATISDPKFAETHLQQYKNSSSRNLLAWENCDDYDDGFYVTEIQKDHIQFVSEIQHSYTMLNYWVLCHCDGLYLKCFDSHGDVKAYVLWNPSCRAYREFWSPITFDDGAPHYGIYYNPMMRDYKVVMANEKRYAVFSCRNNKWSKVKRRKGFYCSGEVLDGVSLNGSFYWLGTKEVGEGVFELEITCFDWKDEKFKKVPMPDCKGKSVWYYLTSSGSHLCMFGTRTRKTNDRCNEMSIWKKASGDKNDSWMEFNVQLQFVPKNFTSPCFICWLNEGEFIFDINRKSNYFLYDQSKNTFVKIKKSLSQKYMLAVVYQENLFLQRLNYC